MGGQGVVLLGTILGTAAVAYDGKYATQASSYGTEARGGPAKSQVVISSRSIGYPEARQLDILVAMTQGALSTHVKTLGKEATVIVDSDLVRDVPSTLGKIQRIPATRLSEQSFASRSYANMVMLGALVRLTGIVSPRAARNAITVTVPPDTVEKNLKAFELGFKAAEDSGQSG